MDRKDVKCFGVLLSTAYKLKSIRSQKNNIKIYTRFFFCCFSSGMWFISCFFFHTQETSFSIFPSTEIHFFLWFLNIYIYLFSVLKKMNSQYLRSPCCAESFDALFYDNMSKHEAIKAKSFFKDQFFHCTICISV